MDVSGCPCGLVSGFLGICVPIASVTGTYLVQAFTGNRLAMFLARARSAAGRSGSGRRIITLHRRDP